MTDIKVGDYVRVTFSDHHVQVGQVKKILDTDSFNYLVTVKVYGKDTDVHCNRKDIELDSD